jgi:outer membrane protein assembly factor BamB
MQRLFLRIVVPVLALAGWSTALGLWLSGGLPQPVKPRVPREPVPEERGTEAPGPELNAGTLIPGPGVPSDLPGNWPQFRGPDRSNVVRNAPFLARTWPEGGPEVAWERGAGEGHSGAAVLNGCVYMMDYDRELREDVVRCLSLADGQEIWRYTYYVKVKRNHGMSRTVPAVTDDYVVTLGPKCHVVCLDAKTGQLAWKKDLVAEFGTEVPPWYAGQCPLIDGGRVILAPGGDPLMMAVDLATGQTLWETPNPGGWGMTHSSILPLDHPGGRQYVYCATQGVIGVSAADGRELWRRTDWKITLANVPTPVAVGEDRAFVSGGYNSGSAMIEVKEPTETEMLWRQPPGVFGSDQQTPILYNGLIYGVIPSGEMACLRPDGTQVWSSGPTNRFGLGPYLLADGVLLVLSDQAGTLHMVEATPDGYNELTAADVLDGHDAWAPMAMAGNRLILRDLTRVVCLELPIREVQ